jgi:hypothetical protein
MNSKHSSGMPLKLLAVCAVLAFSARSAAAQAPTAATGKTITFDMVPSGACLTSAKGHVRVQSQGDVEVMDVDVEGLPPKTDFDFFVIQVPHAPFGLSWYQGDIETSGDGKGHARFVGRFNIETFIVAPGSQPSPVVHAADASSNPPTAPVHTYHLGLWFNNPADAVSASCPGNVTPFNGDHTAGVQVLNTSNFPDLAGPLRQLTP